MNRRRIKTEENMQKEQERRKGNWKEKKIN
jgi:hypothetical protein